MIFGALNVPVHFASGRPGGEASGIAVFHIAGADCRYSRFTDATCGVETGWLAALFGVLFGRLFFMGAG